MKRWGATKQERGGLGDGTTAQVTSPDVELHPSRSQGPSAAPDASQQNLPWHKVEWSDATSRDLSWARLIWLLAIPIVCWLGALAFYVVRFSGGLSSDQALWGQFGDFVGGVVNPVLSIVGLVAVVLTLRANTAAVDETRKQLAAQLFAVSEGHFVSVEQALATVPSALKFHGIPADALAQAGITPQEFAYLMTTFTAGGITSRALERTDRSPLPKGGYRYTMLLSPDTRRAWPLIRQLMNPSPYRDRIQATIDEIEREGAATNG